jgi:DNA (cytosine-5)-methyltransferase 1
MNGLALCAGNGGIELGLRMAFPASRAVCYVERDVYNASLLVKHMQQGNLEQAVIWDDVTTFSGREWQGKISWISAGFPCQPWSVAGNKKGTDDHRWIWPDIARIIGEVRPDYVFIENVRGILAGGIQHVSKDLSSFGFNAEWQTLSASETGSPHKRERVFIFAYRPGAEKLKGIGKLAHDQFKGLPQPKRELRVFPFTDEKRLDYLAQGSSAVLDCPDVCDTQSKRLQRLNPVEWHVPEGWENEDGHSTGSGGVQLWPPVPDSEDWLEVWQKYPEYFPAIEPDFCRVVDGTSYRVDLSRCDSIRSVGNGVLPVQVASAFTVLARRAGMIVECDLSDTF